MFLSPRPGIGRLSAVVLLGFVWFALAFVGGYLQGQADAVSGNRALTDLALRAASSVGLQPALAPRSEQAALSAQDQAQFRVFWEAWGLVSREFYNRAAVDGQKMTYGAVKGMVESLGDPYTAFSTPPEKEALDNSLRGTFDGVGIQVDNRDGQLKVIAPIEGSPAERAGIRAGDVVTQVDGRDLKGLGLTEVITLIRGPRGTTVTLTIERPGEAAPLTFPVERAEIKVENVRGKLLDGGIGYVRIASFTSSSASDLTAALRRLNDQQAGAYVLDLRSNPGGFLNAGIDVASQFMSDGVVLYQRSADGQQVEYRAKAGGQATVLPLAILIDKGSASASEIVAAALRDNGRAVLVGEKSYGKGSVQTVHTLSDQSGLRVTSAIWLTPTGQPLEHRGLDPDLAIPASGEPGQDSQLDAAVRYLQGQATAPAAQDRV